MEELDYKKIGLKMKEVRVRNHIRQERIAKDLDCTIAFVSNVENNRTKLNLRTLAYYSKLCNTPIDVFIKAGYGKEAPTGPHCCNVTENTLSLGSDVTVLRASLQMYIWQEKR